MSLPRGLTFKQSASVIFGRDNIEKVLPDHGWPTIISSFLGLPNLGRHNDTTQDGNGYPILHEPSKKSLKLNLIGWGSFKNPWLKLLNSLAAPFIVATHLVLIPLLFLQNTAKLVTEVLPLYLTSQFEDLAYACKTYLDTYLNANFFMVGLAWAGFGIAKFFSHIIYIIGLLGGAITSPAYTTKQHWKESSLLASLSFLFSAAVWLIAMPATLALIGPSLATILPAPLLNLFAWVAANLFDPLFSHFTAGLLSHIGLPATAQAIFPSAFALGLGRGLWSLLGLSDDVRAIKKELLTTLNTIDVTYTNHQAMPQFTVNHQNALIQIHRASHIVLSDISSSAQVIKMTLEAMRQLAADSTIQQDSAPGTQPSLTRRGSGIKKSTVGASDPATPPAAAASAPSAPPVAAASAPSAPPAAAASAPSAPPAAAASAPSAPPATPPTTATANDTPPQSRGFATILGGARRGGRQ